MKRMSLMIIILLPFLLLGITRTVSLEGTHQFTSIQTAVNACNNGDSVLVYPGRYVENINLNGHNVTIASLYSQTQQQAHIESTIIDGNLNTCIKAMAGETFTVNGFTLVNNEQQINHISTNNGGAFCIWYDCHVYIRNSIIRNCLATWGGGISAGLGTILEFSNVLIHSNQAREWGGGIRFGGGGQLIWDTSHPSSVYNNVAAAGMDFMIDDCPTIVYINIILGSRAMSIPDNYFILNYNSTQQLSVNVVQSFFPNIDCDVYVNPNGNDDNNGLSASTPFRTIRHALQIINSNHDNPRTVHLSPGTYSFSANGQVFPLSLKPHVRIIGSGTGQTIIDGELHSTFFTGRNMQDIILAYMSFINGRAVGTNPIGLIDCSVIELKYLTLSNNQGAYASGIYLLRCNNIICESLDIGNTTISDWNASINAVNCDNLYLNNLISHNNQITTNQDNFVGLCFEETDVIIRNSIIANNTAPDAYVLSYQNVYPEHSAFNLDMSNVLIFNNNITQCSWAFAPVYLQNRFQTMKINNCTFAGNQGGGLFSRIFGYADIINHISYNPGHSGELCLSNHIWSDTQFIWFDTEVNISNSLFSSNTISSDLPELVTFTDNIFNGNPLFEGMVDDTIELSNPEYYHLSANSPCINTGVADTTGMNLPLMDLAGNYRVWDNRIDMGCYEYGSEPVGNDDPVYPVQPDKITLSTYPNPVYLNGKKGAYTFIEFTLPEKAKAKHVIEIYNLKGQKVRTMTPGESMNSLARKAGVTNNYELRIVNDELDGGTGKGACNDRNDRDGRLTNKQDAYASAPVKDRNQMGASPIQSIVKLSSSR